MVNYATLWNPLVFELLTSHLVENNVMTYDVIAVLNGCYDPQFLESNLEAQTV